MENYHHQKGLGDTIENISKKLKIDKVVKYLFGENCGCEGRKNYFNRKYPYNNS